MNRFKAIGSALTSGSRSDAGVDASSCRIQMRFATAGFDRVACEKAKEGPSALRQYIQRIRVIESLYFSDYVNEAQARCLGAKRGEPCAG